MKQTTSVVVRREIPDAPRAAPIVHIPASGMIGVTFDIFYIVLILIAFGLVGSDLGYLIAVGVLVTVSTAFGLLVYQAKGNYWAAFFASCLAMAVMVGSDLDDNVYRTMAQLSGSLQHISWVAVGIITVIKVRNLLHRRG